MKRLMIASVLAASVVLTGCKDVRVSGVDNQVVSELKSSIRYFQDDFGICYAVVQSGRIGYSSSGIGLTAVPCEKIKK